MPDIYHDIYAVFILNSNPLLSNSGSEIPPGPNPSCRDSAIYPYFVAAMIPSVFFATRR